ncbi:ABC transporter ATP-binding protein [Paenarthrobacter sp. Z7-10]|uniref:ABC transporter ATP-binding protein n=1 Tax=Paenarthrobacter sp. Z7-10 TaxID=2787635 RepID=UPI0022A9B9A2|nr:ABC transporter ATP-binding protein [Paenarthrobacter sp. Z7-10]MCZ2403984.1 ABC transporter ATP-binding protein [Paenarthrobacter sp. Z7-10]
MTAADVPLIQCMGICHTFGSGARTVAAVRDATLQIAPGARIALMGPSGSGKSTLLHLLAGLEKPTSGTITGRAYSSDAVPQPHVTGMVFQSSGLIAALDVLENVALPLILAGASDGRARSLAHEALELLNLEALERKLPEELSGGQAQRVAIARVLACRPRLILADEPTGQLDHVTALSVLDVLLRSADSLNAAVLVSTHDPLIAELLDEVWSMHDGVLKNSMERSLT